MTWIDTSSLPLSCKKDYTSSVAPCLNLKSFHYLVKQKLKRGSAGIFFLSSLRGTKSRGNLSATIRSPHPLKGVRDDDMERIRRCEERSDVAIQFNNRFSWIASSTSSYRNDEWFGVFNPFRHREAWKAVLNRHCEERSAATIQKRNYLHNIDNQQINGLFHASR
jgi:hypothetical protein